MPGKAEQQRSEKKGPVKVNDLPQPETELKDEEAKGVKGGGVRGWIIEPDLTRNSGETLPSAAKSGHVGEV